MLYFHSHVKPITSILAATTMNMRFLATTILATALLFSQGGNFLIAALCPHIGSRMASCETQFAAATMSHESMGHMGHMQMAAEPASQQNLSAFALGQPNAPCSHCAVHSRKTTPSTTLRETDAAKRSVELSIPLDFSGVAPATTSPHAVLTSRAHGPPGETIPRHILINIFRI